MHEFEERGNLAFEAAWEREQEHDGVIDMRTAALYRVASTNLINMAWAAPSEDMPADPGRLLKLSHSFAAQAEAPEVEPFATPQFDLLTGQPVDRRENFKRLAGVYLERAGVTVDSAKLVLEASVEAAQETTQGTPVVRGFGEVNRAVLERVTQRGQAGIHEFLGALANQKGTQGAEFTRVASSKGLMELSAV
jgi:hypothetical protein